MDQLPARGCIVLLTFEKLARKRIIRAGRYLTFQADRLGNLFPDRALTSDPARPPPSSRVKMDPKLRRWSLGSFTCRFRKVSKIAQRGRTYMIVL